MRSCKKSYLLIKRKKYVKWCKFPISSFYFLPLSVFQDLKPLLLQILKEEPK